MSHSVHGEAGGWFARVVTHAIVDKLFALAAAAIVLMRLRRPAEPVSGAVRTPLA